MSARPLLIAAGLLPLLAGCGSNGELSQSDEKTLEQKMNAPLGSPSGHSSGPKPANPRAAAMKGGGKP